jgi:geranyl-CoA carboxylase alpha subunit
MRLARDAADMPQAIAGARREAQSAFGDATLMLERLIDNGRHIEIQVFADAHGNAVFLGERDCTAQRRRQKVIEEAPSPAVSPAMREAMGRDAVAAALAVGYRGAGTVEFIVDANLKHYFLEMNTRLQVEHPVTEMVTGFDLVEWQLRVAAGEPLPAKQPDIKMTGHSIEARLYAEDPYQGFAPQTGPILWWRPQSALLPGVRIDDGIVEGGMVTPFYDPMVAKIIVHGRNRDDAIRRLRAALVNAPLLGLRNNARFLSDLVDHPAFRSGAMTTTMIDQWLEQGEPLLLPPVPDDSVWQVAAAVYALQGGAGWRPDSVAAYDLHLACLDARRMLRVRPGREGAVVVSMDGHDALIRLTARRTTDSMGGGEMSFEIGGVTRRAVAVMALEALHLAVDAGSFVFSEVSPYPDSALAQDATRACAPVAGRVSQVQVAVGSQVSEGQALICVEAMKMEMWVTAQAGGTVKALHVTAGEQVESGALLVEMELDAPNYGTDPAAVP